MKNIFITRFAPSPTGNMHLGSIRIAFYSWLLSKKYNGNFFLRIEDTDIKRSNIKFINNIFYILKKFKILWNNKPIFQINRLNRYNDIINYLLDNNKAYICICNVNDLKYEKNNNIKLNIKNKYNLNCRYKNINKKDIKNKNFVIRFKNILNEDIIFNDLIYGKVKINSNEIDDFVIKRSNNIPTYNLCAAIDDYDMNITHIIRGSDHINNTPKQIKIIESIAGNIPKYAHIPILLNENKNKISKRDNNINDIKYFIKNGILIESILNYIYKTDFESNNNNIFSIDYMINNFNINKIKKNHKILDLKKIFNINKILIKNSDEFYIYNKLYIYSKNDNRKYLNIFKNNIYKNKIINIIKIYKNNYNNLLNILDIIKKIIFNYKLDFNIINKIINKKIFNILKYILINKISKIIIIKYIKKNNIYNFNKTLRYILTNDINGPNIIKILEIIDINKIYININKIIKYYKKHK